MSGAVVNESATTRYTCERCRQSAPFPVVAVSPIGRVRCTDHKACELRQLRTRNRAKEHAS